MKITITLEKLGALLPRNSGKGTFVSGYYGVPGKTGGKVHLRRVGEHKPVCGALLRPEAVFQWCCHGAGHLECKLCIAWHRKLRGA